MREFGGSKFTIDAPKWVSEEECAWGLKVAQLIYVGTQLKYVDRSNIKKDVIEGRIPYSNDKSKKSIADSIEIIKATWDWVTAGSRGVEGDIVFQIVIGIPGLDKFTVYVKCWAMNKRRLNRDWILKGYIDAAFIRVYINKISKEPVARVYFGPLPDGEVDPATIAKACIVAIETGVRFHRYLLIMDLEMLNEIQAALLLREHESEYPRVEISSDRFLEKF